MVDLLKIICTIYYYLIEEFPHSPLLFSTQIVTERPCLTHKYQENNIFVLFYRFSYAFNPTITIRSRYYRIKSEE